MVTLAGTVQPLTPASDTAMPDAGAGRSRPTLILVEALKPGTLAVGGDSDIRAGASWLTPSPRTLTVPVRVTPLSSAVMVTGVALRAMPLTLTGAEVCP